MTAAHVEKIATPNLFVSYLCSRSLQTIFLSWRNAAGRCTTYRRSRTHLYASGEIIHLSHSYRFEIYEKEEPHVDTSASRHDANRVALGKTDEAPREEHKKRFIPIDCTCTRANHQHRDTHDFSIVYSVRVSTRIDARNKSSRDKVPSAHTKTKEIPAIRIARAPRDWLLIIIKRKGSHI